MLVNDRIKFFREWTGMNQEQLGKKAFGKKVDQKRMSRLETHQEPRISELLKICAALEVRLEDVLCDYLHPKVKERYLVKYGPYPAS